MTMISLNTTTPAEQKFLINASQKTIEESPRPFELQSLSLKVSKKLGKTHFLLMINAWSNCKL